MSQEAPGQQEGGGLQKACPVLSTDPSLFCVQASVHAGLGTGVVFAIILVIGAIALAAYSYFRLNRRTIGFQHFEVRARNTGTWGWGSSLQFSPWLWTLSGLLLSAHPAVGCLAHTSCLLGGVCAPKSSSNASSKQLLLRQGW